jgi:hypothetical protein
MAVPSLRSRSNANRWAAINKQREESSKPSEEKKEETTVSDEEHKKRMEMLKNLGILKE